MTSGESPLTTDPMWLLGSASQVMVMDERVSPSARSVPGAADNPATVHSIEAILGFRGDAGFHKAASCGAPDKPALLRDAERNVIVTPAKKSRSAESFDGKFRLFVVADVVFVRLFVCFIPVWGPLAL